MLGVDKRCGNVNVCAPPIPGACTFRKVVLYGDSIK